MSFQDFTDQLIFFLREEFSRCDVRLFPKGYRGSTDREKELIRATNRQYIGKETVKMVGNYLFCSNPNGTIQRFDLNALYLLSQREGFEYVLTRIRGSCQVADCVHGGETIIRPLNYTRNRKMLKECIYRRIGDNALTLCHYLPGTDGLYLSAHVPKGTSHSPE